MENFCNAELRNSMKSTTYLVGVLWIIHLTFISVPTSLASHVPQ